MYDIAAARPSTVVVDAGGTVICTGVPELEDGRYWFEGDSACIGAPSDVRWDVRFQWDEVPVTGDIAADRLDVMGATPPHRIVVGPGRPVQRLSGDDRYATSVAVSAMAFEMSADRVYLVRGDRLPSPSRSRPHARGGSPRRDRADHHRRWGVSGLLGRRHRSGSRKP